VSGARRPGRSLGPIAAHIRGTHRAWLEPVRAQFTASSLTVGEVARRAGYAKSRVSELLRGEGLYPTWELTANVITVLRIPKAPMLRLWQAAAIEVHKDRGWIEDCIEQVIQIPGEDLAPVDQAGFVAGVKPHYVRYGSAFLGRATANAAVDETSYLLWLRWEEILGSRELHRTAWQVLRQRVMARTPHTDGRPALRTAARFTRALREASTTGDLAARRRQLEESLALHEAISDLPDAQMDVTILLHLCGLDVPTAADVLGVPPTIVRSDSQHAKRALTSKLALLAPASPVTPAGPAALSGPAAPCGPGNANGRSDPSGLLELPPSGPPEFPFVTQTQHHPTEGTSR
jgi:DNA-directed RNA polymerase specialized sigma24 family protein